jgi:hypothetical protein
MLADGPVMPATVVDSRKSQPAEPLPGPAIVTVSITGEPLELVYVVPDPYTLPPAQEVVRQFF